MNKSEVEMRIRSTGIMAIVRVDTVERGIEIAEGCLAGGVDILEVSYTNNNAGEVINALKNRFGNRLVVGAGTVLESVTARLAILSGAQFIIAPNFSREVQEMANLYQVPYAPGCTSYSEMLNALKAGASFIKAFPISNYYGSDLAKVIKVPCPHIPILSSGGANLENIAAWIKNGTDCVGIGSLLTKGSKDEIANNAKLLIEKVKEARDSIK